LPVEIGKPEVPLAVLGSPPCLVAGNEFHRHVISPLFHCVRLSSKTGSRQSPHSSQKQITPFRSLFATRRNLA
jgi:hypothetical protein